MKLNIRELGTILAALRSWQQHGLKARSNVIQEIATDGMSFDALTSAEIDALAERLNQPETISGHADPDPTRAALEECVRALKDLHEHCFCTPGPCEPPSYELFLRSQAALVKYATARNALEEK